MASFNIDNREVVQLTNQLERLHRSAMPVVVRQTLNTAAFEARRHAIRQFKQNFTVRKITFISSHLTVNKVANTFSLSDMEATMGIPKGKSKAGDDLKFLETGGRGRKHDAPTLLGRKGNKMKGLLKEQFYKGKYKGRKQVYRSGESPIIQTEKAIYRIFRGSKWRTILRKDHTQNNEANPFIAPAGSKTASNMVNIFKKKADKRIARGFK